MCRVTEAALTNPWKKFVNQVHIEVTDACARVTRQVLEAGPAREVDDHPRQGFVERHISMAIAHQTFFVADCLGHCLPEYDADILDGMVGIDFQIATGLNTQINHSVPRYLIEHMLEERDAGGQLSVPVTIEIDLDGYLAFFRIAANFGHSVAHR